MNSYPAVTGVCEPSNAAWAFINGVRLLTFRAQRAKAVIAGPVIFNDPGNEVTVDAQEEVHNLGIAPAASGFVLYDLDGCFGTVGRFIAAFACQSVEISATCSTRASTGIISPARPSG